MADGTRGRPKRNAVDRINIAIDLKDNRKFALLLEHSGLTEGQVLLIVFGLWQFTGSNYAFDGDCTIEQKENGEIEVTEWFNPKLNPDDGPALRRACHFIGQSELLISWLQKAGFLGQDLTVSGWFENQPLAAKIVLNRKLGQMGGRKSAEKKASERTKNQGSLGLKGGSLDTPARGSDVDNSMHPACQISSERPLNGDSLGLKRDSLGFSGNINPTKTLNPNTNTNPKALGSSSSNQVLNSVLESAPDARARAPENAGRDLPSANGKLDKPSVREQACEVAGQISAALGNVSANDEILLYRMVETAVRNQQSDQPVWRILGEVREGIRDRRLTNPFGLVIAELKKLARPRQSSTAPG